MNQKIATIVCGNSGIDYLKHPYKIDVFRSVLFVDEEEFEDYIDITADAFYKRLLLNPNTNVKTSQTSTGDMLEVYKRLESEGFTDAIVVTISSYLSGTFQNAVLAAGMVDSLKVHVFDSKAVVYPEAKMALTAAKMAEEGYSVEEILEKLAHIRDNLRIYFSVDTLKYLVKNGRLSVASGFLGGLLKLKPLLWINPDGKIESIEKIRTSKKALERVKEKFFEEVKDIDFEPFVIYTTDISLAEDIAKEIMEKYPHIKEVPMQPLTPVVGAHAGPGAYALGYIKK
ncbi:MAG: DegV family protein [Bacilli bacterium]|nr:DegV family protein [Bacilli bacterium]